MKKKYISMLVAFALVICLAVTAMAAGNAAGKNQQGQQTQQTQNAKQNQKGMSQSLGASATVIDEGGFFTPDEIERISMRLDAVNAKYGVKAGIVTLRRVNGKTADSDAERLLNDPKLGFKNAQNGAVVMVLVKDGRKITVQQNAAMTKMLSKSEGMTYIREKVTPSLKDNKYGDAGIEFANTVEKMLAYYEKEHEPFDPSAGFSIFAALISLVVSGLGGFGVKQYFVGQMSNVTPELAADAYLERDTFKLTDESDTYLYTDVTVTKKSKGGGSRDSSTSSGGSSSSGTF